MNDLLKMTHELTLIYKVEHTNGNISVNIFTCPVEIDCDSEINSIKPIPRVKEDKVEPMDDFPVFYATTLDELAEAGYEIQFKPITDEQVEALHKKAEK